MLHPLDAKDAFTAEENTKLHKEKIGNFMQPGSPGAKMKAAFDNMLKCIGFPKPLAKAINIQKVFG